MKSGNISGQITLHVTKPFEELVLRLSISLNLFEDSVQNLEKLILVIDPFYLQVFYAQFIAAKSNETCVYFQFRNCYIFGIQPDWLY